MIYILVNIYVYNTSLKSCVRSLIFDLQPMLQVQIKIVYVQCLIQVLSKTYFSKEVNMQMSFVMPMLNN